MTEAAAVAADDRPVTDFVLPGRWWHIALGDADDVARQARNMCRSAVGRRDDRAQLRHDLQTAVERAAVAARDAEATDFYFALEIVPGVPLPASLAVYWPPVPFGLSFDAGPSAAAAALGANLRATQPGATVEVSGGDELALVRTIRTMVGSTFAATGVEGAEELTVSYWVIRPDAPRPLLLSFTTALASLQEDMVALFDAIMSTVQWDVPPAELSGVDSTS